MSTREPEPDQAALNLVHEGWQRLRDQCPQAAWASWQEALRVDPAQEAAREAISRLASASNLPAAARRVYRFRSPADSAQRERWNSVLRADLLEDVERARDAFARLVAIEPRDAEAHFNHALCLAWSAQNLEAIASLARAIRLDATDERRRDACIEAWSLAAILRQGGGAEALTDDVRCTLLLDWSEPASAFESVLAALGPARAMSVSRLRTDQSFDSQGARVIELLDRALPQAGEPIDPASLPRVRATAVIDAGRVEVHSTSPVSLRELELELAFLLGRRFRARDRWTRPLPIDLMDSAAWQFRVPEGLPIEDRPPLVRAALESWYLDAWMDLPRQDLVIEPDPARLRPASPRELLERLQAGRDQTAAIALEAFLQVREQLAQRPGVLPLTDGFSFDFLRRRLGLLEPEISEAAEIEPLRLSTRQLERIDPAQLDESRLAEAFRSAASTGQRWRFARELGMRDPTWLLDRPNRQLARELMLLALEEAGPEEASQWIDAWEAAGTSREESGAVFLNLLRAELALEGRGDEVAALAEARASAEDADDDPMLWHELGLLFRSLGAQDDEDRCLKLALEAAMREDDLRTAARIWDDMGRPEREEP